MKKRESHTNFSKYRKYHDICETIETIDFTQLFDEEIFELSSVYELCTIAKTLIFSFPQPINPNFLLFRKLIEDLGIIQMSKDKNNFCAENFLMFRIAIENRNANSKEKYLINKKFYFSYDVIKKRINDPDFYLSSCLGECGKLTYLLKINELSDQYQALGILTHNFIFPANAEDTDLLIDLTEKLNKDCLESIRTITRKIIDGNAQISFPDPRLILESSQISYQCFLNTNSIYELCGKYININENINIYILKMTFDALFNFASSYILNDYKSLILRAKSYIEMISIFFSVINFRKKDLNKYIEAYSGLIFCSLEKKSVDEYVKEIYNETYKDLLNIDFYSFKSFVRNPLYLLFLKSVNFTDVAKERIKDNKEIKNIYNFSCELVHSSLQLIKYKENMQQMSKALFLFLTKETMDLVNKIKTRIKRVVKSDDVNLNFAKSLDGLNYLYELIETTDVDINQNFETISEDD